jgi:putative membrane protein
MMLLMMLFWLLLLVGLALIIVWVVARLRTQGPGFGESALDILSRRYARGEISREEYERMKQELA